MGCELLGGDTLGEAHPGGGFGCDRDGMGYQSGADDGWRVELSGLGVKSGFRGGGIRVGAANGKA